MAEWVKAGTDLVVGGVAGSLDQVVLNRDNKEEDRRHALAATDPKYVPATKKLPMLSRFGTYYNYGVPLLGLLAIAFAPNMLKGEWETRALTIGGQLAGREATQNFTTKPRTTPATWTVWERQHGNNPPAGDRGGGGGARVGLEF